MNSIKLAIALMRMPRLFLTLFLFPLLLSLFLVGIQVFITTLFLTSINSNERPIEKRVANYKENNIVRALIYGDGAPRPKLLVCRWITKEIGGAKSLEIPPGSECFPDRLDAAVRVTDVQGFDPSLYVDFFQGHIDRLHICSTCSPDIIITPEQPSSPARVDIHSLWAFLIVQESRMGAFLSSQFVEAISAVDLARSLLGSRYLHLKGLRGPISFTGLISSLAIILNLAMLIVIALWLALRAHRNVLDYFSHSGALLPMVAASGNSVFYGAIWLLTAFRVGAFLLASVPILAFAILPALAAEERAIFVEDLGEAVLWILAISVGLGFATLIASISELKHRHTVVGFTYRYLPLLLCLFGATLWGVTFIFEDATFENIRDALASLPMIGMVPILVAPIVKPKFGIFVVHILLTLILIVWITRHNSRWFAAHLEEL